MRIFFLCLIFTFQLNALELACDNVNQIINDKIIDMVKKKYSQVEFKQLKIQTVGTEISSDCDYISFNFPKKIDLKGDVVLKFDAYKDNLFQKRSTKIFRINGWAKVFKTGKIMHRGDNFDFNQVYEDQIKINKVTIHTVSNVAPKNIQFRNFVDKDSIIESWMLERQPDVLKGDKVNAIIAKSKITLTLEARVIQNGHIGDDVRCQLNQNNKIVIGKLHDKKTVIISSL